MSLEGEKFQYKGFECFVAECWGWNAFIGIPQGHPLYGEYYHYTKGKYDGNFNPNNKLISLPYGDKITWSQFFLPCECLGPSPNPLFWIGVRFDTDPINQIGDYSKEEYNSAVICCKEISEALGLLTKQNIT